MPDFHPKPQTKPTPFVPHKEVGDARILSSEKWRQIKEHKMRHEAQGHGLGYQLHIPGKPMYTVTKEALLNNHNLIQWGNTARHMSTAELLEVGSFPHNFTLVGSYENTFNRIGNSVPPKFMQVIAAYIYKTFFQPLKEASPMLDFINAPINPDTPRLFTVISTFAGCGGSSLGYKWAGGKVLAAVEWDDNAVQTYRLNHYGTPVLHRDIKTVTTEELLDFAGLHPGELDILDGSPPCQGFSTAGKRQIDDPRNSLFREYVRLLRGLQPKCFVMENVSGMVKGNMKHVFAVVMRELKASGYQVKCQLMNAMYFGVPQSRERVIFIGVRNDLDIHPNYPEAQNKPVTVRQAFEGVQDDGTGDRVKPHTKIWQAMQFVKQGETQPGHYSHTRLQFSSPSCTLKRAGGLGHYHFWHPTEHRVITLAECKRIATFPDVFQFVGKINEAWDRIGNSVPPRFMQTIASHIYTHILSKTTSLGRIEEVVHA